MIRIGIRLRGCRCDKEVWVHRKDWWLVASDVEVSGNEMTVANNHGIMDVSTSLVVIEVSETRHRLHMLQRAVHSIIGHSSRTGSNTW